MQFPTASLLARILPIALLPMLYGRAICAQTSSASAPPPFVPAQAELNRCACPLTWLRGVTGYGPPIVEVVLNHQVRATFIVDTGSSNTIVTEATAKRLGLEPQILRDDSKTIARFNGRPLKYVHVDSLAINPDAKEQAGRADFAGDIMTLPQISLYPAATQRIDGILGMSLLANCTLLIDPESRRLTLWWTRALTRADRAQIGMEDALEVGLVSRGHGILQVQARLNDREVLLDVDTGAEATIIPSGVAARLRLKPDGPGCDLSTVYGDEHVMETHVRQMAFGGVVRRGQRVNYMSRPGAVEQSLGMDVLGQYRILIDAANKKMYLKPAEVVPLPTLQTTGQTAAP